MANNKVKFLRGTSDEYTAAEKDNDTIYFTTDDGKLYVGDKEILGESIKTLNSHINDSVIHITSAERTNWNAAKTHADSAHAPSDAQANVIETVKVNGTALTPSSKAVNITVPSVGNGTVTLTISGWSSNSQTVSSSIVTENNIVIVTPIPDHQDVYSSSGIKCTSQANGSLVFTCNKLPDINITVNIVVLEK